MPSMNDWNEFGTYLEFLIGVRRKTIPEQVLIQVYKSDNKDDPVQYEPVWDIPWNLYSALSTFFSHPCHIHNEKWKLETIEKVLHFLHTEIESEEKRQGIDTGGHKNHER